MVYEYICHKCQHTWEAEQRITAEPLKQCPQCQQETAKRLISKCSFRLKGQCWSTDGFTKLP